MIKPVIFFAFIALALAKNLTWSGNWYVVNHTKTVSFDCNVPMNGTIANITAPSADTVILDGEGAFDKQQASWWLDWSDNDQNPDVCTADYCVYGNLTTDKGVTFASITWNFTDGSNQTCGVIMTPVQISWVGRWYVLLSGTNNRAECDPPKSASIVNITDDGSGSLLMSGNDLAEAVATNWTLNWGPNDLRVNNACEGVVCTSGNLTIFDFIMESKIVWNMGNEYDCSSTLVRLPPVVTGEELVESDAEETKEADIPSLLNHYYLGQGNKQTLERNLLNIGSRRN